MRFLRTISRSIDGLNEWVGQGVAWVTFLMVVVVFVDVVMRYLFQTSFVFTQELEWHLFAAVFLLGSGYTLLHEGHVRVDIVYQAIGEKAKAWVNLIGVFLFLIPGCYMVVETSLSFVADSWSVLEGSADPGGVPFRFIIKSAIPVGFSLMLIQGISLAIKSFLVIADEPLVEERSA